MSAVVHLIDKIVAPVMDTIGLGSVWNAITSVAQWIVDKVIEPIAAFIFGLLGIKDKDVVTVNAEYIQLAKTKDNTMLKALIKYTVNENPNAVIDSIKYDSKTQRAKFNSPFYLMKAFKEITLPTSEMHVNILDIAKIQKNLRIQLNKPTAVVLTAVVSVPNNNEYIRSMMYKLYGMIGDSFTYNGQVLTYVSSSLNAVNGWYDIIANNSSGVAVAIPTIKLEVPLMQYVIKYTYNGNIYYFAEPTSSNEGQSVVPDGSNRTTAINFMPMIPIRENGNNINGISDQAYVNYYGATVSNKPTKIPTTNYDNLGTTAKFVKENDIILRKLGMSIDAATASVCSRPNITELSSITDATIMFTMDAKSTSPAVMKAIWLMAKYMADTTKQTSTAGTLSNTSNYGKISHGRYNIAYNYNASSRMYRAESKSTDVGKCFTRVVGDDLIVYKQVTETLREEYTLAGLIGMTAIDHGGFANVLSSNLNDSATPVYIPLVFDATIGMTAAERGELFVESFRLVVFSLTVTHLKWYQTPEFFSFLQIIVIVVAIVITVFSLGSGTSPAVTAIETIMSTTSSVAATDAAIATLTSALEAFVVNVLTTEGISYAGTMIADNITSKANEKLANIESQIKLKGKALDKKIKEAKDRASKFNSQEMQWILSTNPEATMGLSIGEIKYAMSPKFLKDEVRVGYNYKSKYDRSLQNIRVSFT